MARSFPLAVVSRLFLDTAPLVYFIERHRVYGTIVDPFFAGISNGEIVACVSPVTLTECLVVPKRDDNQKLAEQFSRVLLKSPHVEFHSITAEHADVAADLRNRYRLHLPDAFQLAVALRAGCDAFLTNDAAFRRVTELRVLLVDDLVTA
jgi:predicted nucleic acid-binding protein